MSSTLRFNAWTILVGSRTVEQPMKSISRSVRTPLKLDRMPNRFKLASSRAGANTGSDWGGGTNLVGEQQSGWPGGD